MYICPFCKAEIVDHIDALNEHRKPGGECEKNEMARFNAGRMVAE